jgi:hypothetical protein
MAITLLTRSSTRRDSVAYVTMNRPKRGAERRDLRPDEARVLRGDASRVQSEPGGDTAASGFRIHHDKILVRVRVARLSSGQAWAEMAPSGTLRVVGSVLVSRGERPDVLDVESALLLYRQRGHDERAMSSRSGSSPERASCSAEGGSFTRNHLR